MKNSQQECDGCFYGRIHGWLGLKWDLSPAGFWLGGNSFVSGDTLRNSKKSLCKFFSSLFLTFTLHARNKICFDNNVICVTVGNSQKTMIRFVWSPETRALDIRLPLVIFQHVFQHGKDLTEDISSPPPPSSHLPCFVSVSNDHRRSGGLTHFSVNKPGMRADWILLWHSAMMLQCCCNNSTK